MSAQPSFKFETGSSRGQRIEIDRTEFRPADVPVPPLPTRFSRFTIACNTCWQPLVVLEVGIPDRKGEEHEVLLTCTICETQERIAG